MKRFKIVGLCLIAAFALSAVAASAASAAKPEFSKTKVTFTSTSGEGKLETKNGTEVKCESDTNEKGEITGLKEGAKMIVKFKGCFTLGAPGDKCQSGPVEGEIETKPLRFRLGYIGKKGETEKVGLLLEPESEASKPPFAEFNCKVGTKPKPGVARGSVIGELTPINTETNKFELNLKAGAGKGEEAAKELEGKKAKLEASVNEGVFEEASETTKDEILTAEKLKVIA